MKFINNINKYSYNSHFHLIDNIKVFVKLNNGIEYYDPKSK
jgi:hypothetical protein